MRGIEKIPRSTTVTCRGIQNHYAVITFKASQNAAFPLKFLNKQ